MTNSEYEKIIKESNRVDWYGAMVPEPLITKKVKFWADSLVPELHILEGEVSDLKGVAQEKRKRYIKSLWYNLRNAPYSLNGDVSLAKMKRIEEEISKKEEKTPKTPKKRTKTKKKTTTKSKTTSGGEKTESATKNSSLIFGKNK